MASQNLFEFKLGVLRNQDYMPRVSEVNLPCQWLRHCFDGKCPVFRKKNGNYYCAKKTN